LRFPDRLAVGVKFDDHVAVGLGGDDVAVRHDIDPARPATIPPGIETLELMALGIEADAAPRRQEAGDLPTTRLVSRPHVLTREDMLEDLFAGRIDLEQAVHGG